MQEMSTHDQLSFVRFDARSRVFVVLGLALCQFGSSFHWDRVTCEKRCMARFQSVLSDVLVASASIFLCPLSFLSPRIVRRHVLLSSR